MALLTDTHIMEISIDVFLAKQVRKHDVLHMWLSAQIQQLTLLATEPFKKLKSCYLVVWHEKSILPAVFLHHQYWSSPTCRLSTHTVLDHCLLVAWGICR